MRYTTPSFKDVEGEQRLTSPNLLAAGRAVGGIALGIGMAANMVDPTTAVAAASGLAATDAEGSVILATRPFPRLQKAIRAVPSRWGRILDPVADKIYAVSVFAGGTINGSIPIEQAAPVLAMEAATVGATVAATSRRGGETPEVGQVNKIGMVARMLMIAGNLGAGASQGGAHEALATSGKVGFAGAVGLGGLSIVNIWRQGGETAPEQPLPEQPFPEQSSHEI